MKLQQLVRVFLWSVAIMVGGILLAAALAGCHPFSFDEPPEVKVPKLPGLPEIPRPDVDPPTQFASDLRHLCLPICWFCIVGGIVGAVAARWLTGLSAKSCGIAIGAGFALLFAMNFLIRFEWVIDILAWVCVAAGLLALAHWGFNKLAGKEGADPIDTLKSLWPFGRSKP